MFKFSNKSAERLSGVDARMKEVMEKAITLSLIDFGIPKYGGLRTEEDQKFLYEDGKSKADGVRKKSKHQSGKAIDVYAYVDGKASWEPEHLSMVAAAVLQAASSLGYSVEWGGLWKSFRDMPHFQLGGS